MRSREVDFYLVRHGEADPRGLDSARRLTPAGRSHVARVAQAASARHVSVAEILHSGLLRAQETAEILAEFLRPPKGVRSTQGLAPEDDPVSGKAEMEAAENPLMLVGHLPYMNRLVALLVTGDPGREIISFPPATLVCCSREASAWNISWILTPDGAKQS